MNGNGGKLEILDTTLRDGAQAESISFSLQDKIALARALDGLGIPLIEAGMPGATPKDTEFFAAAADLRLANSTLVAFGPTMRPGGKAATDTSLAALLAASTPVVSLFGKAWRLHVEKVLETTLDENLRIVRESVSFLAAAGRRVIFDAEHFFDGYADDPEYALSVCRVAMEAGASVLCLCETNGGAFPAQVADATAAVARLAAGRCAVGIHCHDDTGLAVANTMAAVEAGATHVQGTLCGFGERCGNANLATLIGNLQLKRGIGCIPADRLASLTGTVRQVAAICNVTLPGGAPYVGRRAFAHKGGMHADGVRKFASSFEHVKPESVGNARRFLVSEMAGRSALIDRINAILPGLTRDDEGVGRVLARLKELEQRGWQFEGADGSFEILVRKTLRPYPPFFELERFRLVAELSVGETHDRNTSAMIKVSANGEEEITAAEGNGPVNALDRALRKALEKFYPRLAEMKLTDFKVRVIDTGAATASIVRVMIESTDGARIWNTVGVSCDIIEASWLALLDSVESKLLHDAESAK